MSDEVPPELFDLTTFAETAMQFLAAPRLLDYGLGANDARWNNSRD